MNARAVRPAARVEGRVRVPGSKSLTLRALVCAGLARGASRVEGALASSDAARMVQALRGFGADLRLEDDATEDSATWNIVGTGGAPRVEDVSIDVADCGTCLRVLCAIAAACETARVADKPATITLDGTPRLRERPIGGLARALAGLGVLVDHPGEPERAPLRFIAGGLSGGRVEVDASESSQYVTALLLAAPLARGRLEVVPVGTFPSRPYVQLTIDMMRAFGVEVDRGEGRFVVEPGPYRAASVEIEGDFSSASYFFTAAAIARGSVEVLALRADSAQGDRGFLDYLETLGHSVESTADGVRVTGRETRGDRAFDFADCPDVVPSAAIAAAFHEGTVTLSGAPHLRHKESDRIAATATELRRLGAEVEERDDGMVIRGGRPLLGAAIRTYDDHRIAMSFAIAGLVVPGIEIEDPGCTAKSYPGFFDALEHVTET